MMPLLVEDGDDGTIELMDRDIDGNNWSYRSEGETTDFSVMEEGKQKKHLLWIQLSLYKNGWMDLDLYAGEKEPRA